MRFGVDDGEAIAKFRESVGIAEVAELVGEATAEPIDRRRIVCRQEFADLLAEGFYIEIVDGDSHDREGIGEQLRFHQIEECGNQLAFR